MAWPTEPIADPGAERAAYEEHGFVVLGRVADFYRRAGDFQEAEGALRLLLVPVDDPRAGRVLAVLARDVEELRLSAPLTLPETERYVRTRLVRSGAPEAARMRAAIERCASSADYIEGRRAFMEKRRPQFVGK